MELIINRTHKKKRLTNLEDLRFYLAKDKQDEELLLICISGHSIYFLADRITWSGEDWRKENYHDFEDVTDNVKITVEL